MIITKKENKVEEYTNIINELEIDLYNDIQTETNNSYNYLTIYKIYDYIIRFIIKFKLILIIIFIIYLKKYYI